VAAQVTPLQALPDDFSGTDHGLPLVWSYSAQAEEASTAVEG